MPKPRTKQSPVISSPLIAPGFRGLNTEAETTMGLADPLWALRLDNAVFDARGHLVHRKGYVDRTTTPINASPTVHKLHEYVLSTGATQLIAHHPTASGGIDVSDDDGATWTSILGSLVTNTTNWKMVNFKGDLFLCAPGHKLHKYIGDLNAVTEVTGSPVSNGILMAAFGRLWMGQDGTDVVKYSGLLDGDTWTGTGTGGIDASNAWTNTSGQDDITGLGAFGSTFVIFGTKNILLYVDGEGSVLGVNPDQMYVADTIEGTGCISQDSIVSIGEGDLWFQSQQGVQSLARVIKDKVNPLATVTANVRSLAQKLQKAQTGSAETVQAIYSPANHFVLFLYPSAGEILMFDTRFQLPDGTYRVSRWTGLSDLHTMILREDLSIWFGMGAGNVGEYTGYRDDGAAYNLIYSSPWLDFGAEVHSRLKILKGLSARILCIGTVTATLEIAADFGGLPPTVTSFGAEQVTISCDDAGDEWNEGEWAIAEWGPSNGGPGLELHDFAGAKEGQYLRVQLTIENTEHNSIGGIHSLTAKARIGRPV